MFFFSFGHQYYYFSNRAFNLNHGHILYIFLLLPTHPQPQFTENMHNYKSMFFIKNVKILISKNQISRNIVYKY